MDYINLLFVDVLRILLLFQAIGIGKITSASYLASFPMFITQTVLLYWLIQPCSPYSSSLNFLMAS